MYYWLVIGRSVCQWHMVGGFPCSEWKNVMCQGADSFFIYLPVREHAFRPVNISRYLCDLKLHYLIVG